MTSNDFWTWFDTEAAPKLDKRANTFRKMFEYLDRFDRPVCIVETGCIREKNDWAAGYSTVLFDHYAQAHPRSFVMSIDISSKNVRFAKKATSKSVTFICSDSVASLRRWAEAEALGDEEKVSIDLLYLDSLDVDWINPVPSALHHLNEVTAALPMLRADSLVAVDDAPETINDCSDIQIGGKGELVARYAFSVGADLLFSEYQIGWTNMTVQPSREPETISNLIMRARSHVEHGHLMGADPLYRLVLSLTHDPPLSAIMRIARGEACAFFAKKSLLLKQYGTAADWYLMAVRVDPAAVEYRLALATHCYYPMRLLDPAVIEAQRAVQIEPENSRTWRVLGNLEHENRHLRKAAVAYDRAIALEPDVPGPMLDRATVAIDSADYDLAKTLCAKAMGTDREADALHLLAMVAYRESRHEEAIVLFDRAIAANCLDTPVAHWHKSISLEAIGRWREAWAERAWRVNSRLQPIVSVPMKRFNAPLWAGQHGPGRVHVHAEAGAGDNICLVRYLPLIANLGLDVCYEAPPEFAPLMQASMPGIEVMAQTPYYPDGIAIKPFDWHIPVGHLQHVFGTTVETVPWSGPYLKANPELMKQFENRLPKGKLRVGLCWSSGIRLEDTAWLCEYGKRKSMRLATLFPGLKSRDAFFVSLQVGPERDELKANDAVHDLLPEVPTWNDTAALVECLDLVITVDTAVAHLAGAMGKPVWVMTPRDAASWHFMCWRPGAPWNDRSPWYPSARVFRQHRFNEPHYWDEVVTDVARELGLWNVAQAAE